MQLLSGAAGGLSLGTGAEAASPETNQSNAPTIDRAALVQRHNPTLQAFDALAPLSVGNGEFAFTADVTGLQTFPQLYEKAMPLCTMTQCGWHTLPQPLELRGQTLKLTDYHTHGRPVAYHTRSEGQLSALICVHL